MRTTLSTLWHYWKRFGHTFGRFQTQLVMTLSYLCVFGPGRLVLALGKADPLAKRFPDPASTFYAPKEPSPTEITAYFKQF
ncbi:hypothetical protein JXA88_13060 [Candidatus Fermentibacteria bacterium]|nr:hypothetical protein [Candidatus Fermentibacteria bacterium]